MPAIHYHVDPAHHLEVTDAEGNITLDPNGSVFHPEMTVFAGLVIRDYGDATFDIVFFPPNRPPVFLTKVAQGSGEGQFELDTGAPRPPTRPR